MRVEGCRGGDNRGSWSLLTSATSTNNVYTLYSASTLSGKPDWTNVPGQTAIAGSDGIGMLVDTNVAPMKFYRVGERKSQ